MLGAEQIQEKWVVFWWAFILGLSALAIAWRHNFFKISKPASPPSIRGIDVFKGFGYFLFAELFFVPFLVGLFFSLRGDTPSLSSLDAQTKGWINLWVVLGGFFAISWTYLQLTPLQQRQLWQQNAVPWYSHIGMGIVSWFISYPIALGFSQLISLIVWYFFQTEAIEQIAIQNLRQTKENPWLFGMTALAVIVIVPLTEEFLFRGLLQSWLKRRFHLSSVAILLSSFIFTLFHYSSHQGFSNIEILSPLFILSCMLGFIYERQGSLWAPFGLHSFFNLMSLLMLLKT